jgi:hypothetical protein
MHALLMLAAEAGGHEESSKTAFYVAGSLLAGWAVVVSVVGLRKADFPATESAGRGVVALTVLLVAAVMASAILTG